MSTKSWQWRNIQEKLRLFGRALQGPEPYRIECADEPALTGVTDFEPRQTPPSPRRAAPTSGAGPILQHPTRPTDAASRAGAPRGARARGGSRGGPSTVFRRAESARC